VTADCVIAAIDCNGGESEMIDFVAARGEHDDDLFLLLDSGPCVEPISSLSPFASR
jgi:hypothetical protein